MSDIPSTAEPLKPRRRWYQFRLRTLLIVVALLAVACGYVAHERRIVFDRQGWLLTHVVREEVDISDVPFFRRFSHGNPTQGPSWVRLLLGDRPHRWIIVRASTPIAEWQAAAAIFPEADICELPIGY